MSTENRYELNKNLAQMLKGGVIMDVTTPEQAKIAEAAGAAAVLAVLDAGDVDLLGAAEGRLLKGDRQAHPEVLALLGRGAAAGGGPAEAEAAAEDVAQDVPQVAEVAEAEAAAPEAAVGVKGRVAVLVVALLLLRVGQQELIQQRIGVSIISRPSHCRCCCPRQRGHHNEEHRYTRHRPRGRRQPCHTPGSWPVPAVRAESSYALTLIPYYIY